MTKDEFHKKWENFWYYHKNHTIIVVIAIVIMTVLIKQCASRIFPDLTVTVVTKSVSVSQDQLNDIQNMLQNYTVDVNRDGRKNVVCDNYDFGPKQDPQLVAALQEKLIADFQATNSALFITDDAYFKQFSSEGILAKLSDVIPGAPDKLSVQLSSLPDFKNSGLSADNGKLLLLVRKYKGSPLANKSNIPYYNNSINVLKKLLQDGGLVK
jgi:hypothetical protein